MGNTIHIVCATDENYAPFASIMMKSVLRHTRSFVNFYILDGGIVTRTKKLIAKDLRSYRNKCVHYVDMKRFDLSRFPNIRHYSLNTFSRYFIPELFSDLKRVLYMDVDIIAKKDIAELYYQNMEKYPIAAVLEDFYEGNYKTLKTRIWPSYEGKDQYFNAGIILFDIPKLRNLEFTKKTIQLTTQLYHKLSCPDQDVLNILFENNFKVLDYRFNYMPDHFHLLKRKHPEIHTVDPVVIHYTAQKPWKDISLASGDFNEVACRSVFWKSLQKQYHTKFIAKFFLFGYIPLFHWRKHK